jgi:hypothetical protein
MHIVLFHDHGWSQPTPLALVRSEHSLRSMAWYILSVFTYLPQPVVVPCGDVAVHIVLYQRQEHHVQGAHVPYIVQVNHAMSAHQSEKGVVEPCCLLPHLTPQSAQSSTTTLTTFRKFYQTRRSLIEWNALHIGFKIYLVVHQRAYQEWLYYIWTCRLLVFSNQTVFSGIVRSNADRVSIHVNHTLVSFEDCCCKLVRCHNAPHHKVGRSIYPPMNSELPFGQLVVRCKTCILQAEFLNVSN